MRTGILKERQRVLTWKRYDGIPGNDRSFYADAGSRVYWNGTSSNEGYEHGYGGRRLLWVEVWSEELQAWMQKGLEGSEVEWDD